VLLYTNNDKVKTKKGEKGEKGTHIIVTDNKERRMRRRHVVTGMARPPNL